MKSWCTAYGGVVSGRDRGLHGNGRGFSWTFRRVWTWRRRESRSFGRPWCRGHTGNSILYHVSNVDDIADQLASIMFAIVLGTNERGPDKGHEDKQGVKLHGLEERRCRRHRLGCQTSVRKKRACVRKWADVVCTQDESRPPWINGSRH